MMSNKRIEWIDIMKGLAILFVVVGHTNSPINKYIYLFHVPAFFFLSGFTTTIDKKSPLVFLWNKIRTLLIPFFGINILLLVLTVMLSYTRIGNFLSAQIYIKDLWNSISVLFLHGAGVDFGGATWFLLVLFGASILIKFLFFLFEQIFRKDQLKEIKCWALFTVSVLLLMLGYHLYSINYQINYMIDLCLNAQFYFVLGIVFRKFSLFEKIPKIVFVPIAVFAIYYFSHVHWAPMNWPTRTFSLNPLENILSSLAGIYLTYILSLLIYRNLFFRKAFVYLGERSLSVLAFHFLGMKVSYFIFYFLGIFSRDQVKQFIPPVGNNYWLWLTFMCIIFSIVVDYVIRKNKYAAFTILGKNEWDGQWITILAGKLREIPVVEQIRLWWLGFINDLHGSEQISERGNLSSPKPAFHLKSQYKETFVLVTLFGLIIFLLNKEAFNGFFYSEDFNWTSLYFSADGNFIKAIFTPIMGIFFRPASIAWIIGTQLILPWDPAVHHVRNFLFTLINLFLLHRIMLRVTASQAARMMGMSFFALSKVHLTTIGLINAVEIVVTLMHSLLAVLFLLRYIQEHRRVDYLLSIVFFTFTVFSRDYSVVFIAVVFTLFIFFTYESWIGYKSWKTVVIKFLPFFLVVCVYLLIRFTILGFPGVGGDAPYAISINFGKLVRNILIAAGNLLNLSLTSVYASAIGHGDLSTLLTDNEAINRIYRISFAIVGSLLFIWTVGRGVWRKKWSSFSLVWAVFMVAPTFLIANPFIYYIYESAAAIAVLLSTSLDYKAPDRRTLFSFWAIVMLVIALNGYAHNQNIVAYGWRWMAEQTVKLNEQVFVPNRNAPIRSLTIVTETQDQANLVQYLVAPPPFDGMTRALLTPHKIDFRVLLLKDFTLTERMQQGKYDLVYLLNSDMSYTPILPAKEGVCTSFENDDYPLKTSWVLVSNTSYKFNVDPAYISNGSRSIQVSVNADGIAVNHFGGIELPMPHSQDFSMDFWVDNPQNLKTIYMFASDEDGHPVLAWVNSSPAETLIKNKRYNLTFRPGLDNLDGFKWTPQENLASTVALHFFVDVKDDVKVNYYLDQLCELQTNP